MRTTIFRAIVLRFLFASAMIGIAFSVVSDASDGSVGPMRLGTTSVQNWVARVLAYSQDGTLLATAAGGRIRLYDGATGRLTATLDPSPTIEIEALAFGGRGMLGAVSRDGALRVWDVHSKRCLVNESLPATRIVELAFSNGRPPVLATVNADDIVQVWRLAFQEERWWVEPGPKYAGTAVSFSSDGQWMAYGGGSDRMIHILNLRTRENHRLPNASNRLLTSLRFVKGGEEIVANVHPTLHGPSEENVTPAKTDTTTIAVWNLSTGTLARTLSIETGPDKSCRLDASTNGSVLAAITDRMIRVWHTESWRLISEMDERSLPAKSLGVIVLSGDARRMAVGGGVSRVQLWDVVHRKTIPAMLSHPNPVAYVAAATGERIVTASAEGKILAWTSDSAAPVLTLNANHIRSLALSPQGDSLVVGTETTFLGPKQTSGSRGICVFWSLADVSVQGTRELETPAAPTALRFSPDGRLLAIAATQSGDPFADPLRRPARGAIIVWDMVKGDMAREFSTQLESVACLRFGDKGKRLAGLSREGRASLWDLQTGRPVEMADVGSGWQLLGPQGDRVFRIRAVEAPWSARAARSTMVIQGLHAARDAATWEVPLGAVSGIMAASNTGEVAVLGLAVPSCETARRPIMQVYRGATGELIWSQAFDGTATCLTFSDDGHWLVAGLADGTALAWRTRPE